MLAARKRLVIVLLTLIITALGIETYLFLVSPTTVPPSTELRIPITNPQLEPDRPDLIGEPRIPE